MDRSEAEARIAEVQRIMERTTLYTLLPGPPAIVGGILALAACAATAIAARSLDFADVPGLSCGAQIAIWAAWCAVAIVGIGYEILWVRAKARRMGLLALARPARVAAFALSPSVLVAMVITARLFADLRLEYLAPVWMMCYGTGLYAAGLFSVKLPRVLGLLFIATGTLGLLMLPTYGILLAGVSFGLYHLAFGVAVVLRARRNGEA